MREKTCQIEIKVYKWGEMVYLFVRFFVFIHPKNILVIDYKFLMTSWRSNS